MTTCTYHVGDVFDVMATMPDGSVDLILTSPPFLALRSYLPPDHPDKAKEIGSEPNPAAFIDTLLRLTAEWRRLLAPHGTLAVELGDTYSGSGGSGGDYNDDGLRAGQAKWSGSASRNAKDLGHATKDRYAGSDKRPGWPLAKSLCLIPELYRIALVYGINPLTGQQSPAGRWRARNVVRWVRPNPPVGALCVDDRTEALTPDGWKRHEELVDGDLIAAYDHKTDSCRFLPAKFVRWERENEPMISIEKRSTSQLLTEDHRCWTRTRKSPPHVRLARDLTNDCDTLLCAPFDDVPGVSPVTTERAALLGWFIAEGTPHHRQARIVQSETANPQKVAEIRRLLEVDGADFIERTHIAPYNDSTIVTFNVKGDLAEWLNLHHKRLPMAYVTTWPEAQVRALFDALIDGDGHRRKNADGLLFHQQDERVIDAVQVLAIRLGWRATKSWQPSLRAWQITMSKDTPTRSTRWTKLRKWDGEGIRRETYTGTVWCPMVETSFWLARRNGKTFITGNSDKFRPATSDLLIACTSPKRWFDLDAVRTVNNPDRLNEIGTATPYMHVTHENGSRGKPTNVPQHPAGAPPLDWWEIPPGGYQGSHYAVFPPELCVRPVKAMCPAEVCRTCGEPRRRVAEHLGEPQRVNPPSLDDFSKGMREALQRASKTHYEVAEEMRVNESMIRHYLGTSGRANRQLPSLDAWTKLDRILPFSEELRERMNAVRDPLYLTPDRGSRTIGGRLSGGPRKGDLPKVVATGWTDCGHGDYRPGRVLDPFGGSGTTGLVATGHGREAWLIDLDERNADLARERLGMFLTVNDTRKDRTP